MSAARCYQEKLASRILTVVKVLSQIRLCYLVVEMLRMRLLIVMATITMATPFVLNVHEAPLADPVVVVVVVATEAAAMVEVVTEEVVTEAEEEATQEEDTEVVMIDGQVVDEAAHNRLDDLITELLCLVRCSVI